MKHLNFLNLLLIAIILSNNGARADTFSWTAPTGTVTEHWLFQSYTSLSCENKWVASGADTSITVPNSLEVSFFSMKAYDETAIEGDQISPSTYEIAVKSCDGVACQADFEVTTNGGSVVITWELLNSIESYRLKYKELTDTEYTYLDISGGLHVLDDLVPGTYDFFLFIINSEGNTIDDSSAESRNVYSQQQLIIANNPPPEPPDYKVEAIDYAGWSATLAIPLDTMDTNIDYYVINAYTSSAAAIAGGAGNIFADQIVARGSHSCQSVTFSKSQPIIFFSIYSVDLDGQAGDHVVGYKLFGNAIGTDNEGTLSTSVRVDGADYTALRTYYFQPFTHSSNDYCSEADLYSIFPLNYQERMDYNGDGRVDGWEYNLFRAAYGLSGAGF